MERVTSQRQCCPLGHQRVWLHCADWEASTVLGAHLDDVVARLEARSDLTARVSKDGVTGSSDWR